MTTGLQFPDPRRGLPANFQVGVLAQAVVPLVQHDEVGWLLGDDTGHLHFVGKSFNINWLYDLIDASLPRFHIHKDHYGFSNQVRLTVIEPLRWDRMAEMVEAEPVESLESDTVLINLKRWAFGPYSVWLGWKRHRWFKAGIWVVQTEAQPFINAHTPEGRAWWRGVAEDG